MWFYETFLPSLYAQAGHGKKWLSAKQTAICVRNMEQHTSTTIESDGICRHLYYTCVWQNRKVTLHYSKKNGCGLIMFGHNESEQHAIEAASAQDQQNQEKAHIAFINSRPDLKARKIKAIEKELSEAKAALAEEMGDIQEDSEKYIAYYNKEISRLLAEREKYL